MGQWRGGKVWKTEKEKRFQVGGKDMMLGVRRRTVEGKEDKGKDQDIGDRV